MFALQILSDNVIIGLLSTLTVSLVSALTAIVIWVFNSQKKEIRDEMEEVKTVVNKFIETLTKKLNQTDTKLAEIDKTVAVHKSLLQKK